MDWHPVTSVQQQTPVMTFVISAFQMSVLHFGHFFENRKNSGLTPGQNDDPVTRTWKMTQMTPWPGDPMTQFHVWCVWSLAGCVDGDAADIEQVRAVFVCVGSGLSGRDARPLCLLLRRVHPAQVWRRQRHRSGRHPHLPSHTGNTLTYDTIRDAILTGARKPTWVRLIYRTEPTTKKCENCKN